jgi:hypothetical protein
MNDHTPRHETTPRRRTINSKGEIVDRPYGVSRWANPKTYGCAHTDCVHPAKVLKAANAHPVAAGMPTNAHNCCGTHEALS